MPQYIQDIVFGGSAPSNDPADSYNGYYPCVTVDYYNGGKSVRVWVGKNVGWVHSQSNNYIRLAALSTNNPLVYIAYFTIEDDLSWNMTSPWTQIEPSNWFKNTNNIQWYWYSGSTISGITVDRDFYIYTWPNTTGIRYGYDTFTVTSSQNSIFRSMSGRYFSSNVNNLSSNGYLSVLKFTPADRDTYYSAIADAKQQAMLEGQQQIIQGQQDIIDSQEEQTSRIGGFFDSLADKIKGFFIPSDPNFFDDYKDDFNDLLSDHLGILYDAPALFINIFQVLSDYEPTQSNDYSDYYVNFPELKYGFINGSGTVSTETFFNGDVIDFGFLNDSGPVRTLYLTYRTFITAACVIMLVLLAWRKFEKVMNR